MDWRIEKRLTLDFTRTFWYHLSIESTPLKVVGFNRLFSDHPNWSIMAATHFTQGIPYSHGGSWITGCSNGFFCISLHLPNIWKVMKFHGSSHHQPDLHRSFPSKKGVKAPNPMATPDRPAMIPLIMTLPGGRNPERGTGWFHPVTHRFTNRCMMNPMVSL